MKSLFEATGGNYTRQGDYLLPDLKLPETGDREIGVWGRASASGALPRADRRGSGDQRYGRWLKAQHRVLYYNLLTKGRLNETLADANERAERIFDQTVKAIIRNEVYLGHMVQNKTGTVSYKVNKQVSKPKEAWIRVENTHEPLISQGTWDAVQRMDNHPSKGRSGSAGELSLFAGVLYCMDCGSSMRILKDYRSKKRHTDGHLGEYKAYMCNRYGCGGKAACSSHYINCKTLTELLLLDIRYKAILAQNSSAALREKILAQKNAASMEQTKALRATLTALDKRLAELEKLVVSTYEDKVKGAIPEAVCVQLVNRYEAERQDKLKQRTQLTSQLEATREDEQSADGWLNLIRDYASLEQLDRPTLLRLVKRIEVGEKYELNGKNHRDIKIYYNFVGYIEI